MVGNPEDRFSHNEAQMRGALHSKVTNKSKVVQKSLVTIAETYIKDEPGLEKDVHKAKQAHPGQGRQQKT